MTASHWDRLPDNIKGLVYQFDSTVKDKFDKVLKELTDRVYNALMKAQQVDYTSYTHSGIARDHYQLPLQLRRRSKVTNLYLKKKYRFPVSIAHFQPVQHNSKALRLQQKQRKIQDRWRIMVNRYLFRVWKIMFDMSSNPNWRLYKRLLVN